jgi:hypothetical protein
VGALRVEALAEEEAVTNWQSQSCSRSPYRMERTALAVCEVMLGRERKTVLRGGHCEEILQVWAQGSGNS